MVKILNAKGVGINYNMEVISLNDCTVFISKKSNDGFDIRICHPELGWIEPSYWNYYEDAVKGVEEAVADQFGDDVLLNSVKEYDIEGLL